MKKLSAVALACMALVQASIAQDTDSLVLENTRYLKKQINLLEYRLSQLERGTQSGFDSLQSLSSSSQRKLERLEAQAKQQHKSLQDSLGQNASHLEHFLTRAQRQLSRSSTLHLATYGVATGLIILLLVLFFRERKKTIDHLIHQGEKMAGQNEQILEKTAELDQIRNDLEKNLKQQKKLKKKVKKIKK